MNWDLGNIEWVVAIGICTVMWLFGSYFILKKSSTIQSVRRILFLLLAVLGLVLIVIQPHYSRELDPEVVHIYTSSPSHAIEKSENNFKNVHAFLISEVVDKTSEVHIHGIGLEQSELDLLKNKRIIFHPAEKNSGITNLSVPEITERVPFTLSGSYQGEDVERIYLVGADETIYEGDVGDGIFQINSMASVAGSYLLHIHTILSSNDTISEVLPIEVGHEPTWQMLVLSSFPAFEINYLKNYWTSLGNGFAMRSKISKEKYFTSFVNTPKRNLDNLTRKTVSEFDFIVTDVPTWNQLSTNEQTIIKLAIANNGLALMIRPGNNNVAANNLTIPQRGVINEIKWKTSSDDVALNLSNIPASWSSTRQQGHDIAKYQSSGLGHIALIAVDNTYKLILADEEKAYQNLWSAIFSDLFRDFSPTSELLHNQWIWEEEKSTVSILSNQEIDSPPVLNDSIRLSYLTVPYLKGVTEVTLWPSRGYNQIKVNDGETALKFYAHQDDSWPSVRQNQLFAINQQAADLSASVPVAEFQEDRPISTFWWYGLCLLGLGALWLDERLFG